MPHQMGRCACGREIHWPADSMYGDHWTCFSCGRRYTLVPDDWRGRPTRTVDSRPRRRRQRLAPSPAPKPQVVIVHVTQPQPLPASQPNPFVPPNLALPAPPPYPQQRKGLIGWLLGG